MLEKTKVLTFPKSMNWPRSCSTACVRFFKNLCNINTVIFPEKKGHALHLWAQRSLRVSCVKWPDYTKKEGQKLFGVCVCVPYACINVVQKIRLHWNQVNIISLAQKPV